MHTSRVFFSFFNILSTVFLCFHLHAEEQPPAYTVIENEARLPLLTPTFADRKVLKIRLANGLEAYLISDPKADKSAAALSVKVGSWDDPKDSPGLAHFLEHMLFLGTKKYPNPSEYSSFITEHDGTTNAYTTSTYTSYMFSVDNQAFEEGLDRFASFFREPLFNPSGVAREVQIIDQEYAKNLDNDGMRDWFVWKELGSPDHPFHSFNIGNKETLSNVSQTTLQNWYHQHYSANLMSLIVYSNLPIDKLRDLVVSDFSGVVNQNRGPTSVPGEIFPDSMHGQMVYIEPVKDIRTLTIMWELPKKFTQMKDVQPDTLVCFLIGHEGEESLLAELKKEELAEALRCGKERIGLQVEVLSIEIDLTDQGVKNVDTVIERCFQAIARFKDKKVPSYIFDEVYRMSTTNYEYQPRQDAFDHVMKMAGWIVDEDLKTFPEQTLIIQKFDPEAVQQLFEILTPQNAYFYLAAPSTVTGVSTSKKEKWLGVPYTVKKIDSKVMQQWTDAAINPQINLPAPNPFIPKNLALANHEEVPQKESSILPHPTAILDNERGKTYYSPDTRFLVPKVYVSFEIKTPHIDMGNATKIVLADLYVESITEALKRISYPASLAGLNYTVEREDFGLSINMYGYNDNISLLFNEIVKQLKDLHPSEQQFAVYKSFLLRDYTNMAKKSVIEQAGQLLKKTLYRKFTTDAQKASAIRDVTYSKFNHYLTHLFSQIYLEGIVYGNLSKQDALRLSESISHSLGGLPYPKSQQKKPEVIMLPSEKGPFYLEATTKAQGNAVILAIEYPSFSFKIEAAQQVLMQAMKEPFFSSLRTKQQTGYIVFNYFREIERHLFNIFAVQSNTHALRDLLARFELFIETYLQEISEELPETRFDIIRQTLVNTLKEPAKDIQEMGELLQKLAFKYDADFDWIDKRIKGFKDLSYGEFIDLAQSAMGKDNKRRFAILLKGNTREENVLNYRPISNLVRLRKLSSFPALLVPEN